MIGNLENIVVRYNGRIIRKFTVSFFCRVTFSVKCLNYDQSTLDYRMNYFKTFPRWL